MRSLRSRLILGSSLVALVPLAIVMFLLSQRIGVMMRTQATERLNAALGSLQTRLRFDGEQLAGKLRILGRDPTFKRLYLLRPEGNRDLSEHVAERRFLLDLDFLQVVDSSGNVVADASLTTRDEQEPWRVGATQRPGLAIAQLEGAPGLAMTATAPIRYENATAGLLQGGLVFDSAFLTRLGRASGVELILRDAQDRVVAATLDSAQQSALPAAKRFDRLELGGGSYLGRSFALEVGPSPHASITGLVSTAPADQTIATLQLTAAFLGVMGVGIAILLGIFWSSQISRPVEQLAAYSHELSQGRWDRPLKLDSVRELQTLVIALDGMRSDLQTYRARLLTSERQAAWSQMARKVAHEIKNPLTPIAVSVADLKRSYELKRADFPQILDQAARVVAQEVETLKRLLQEFSEFGRFPAPRLAPVALSNLLSQLETLYVRDVAEGRLSFARPDRDATIHADAGQMRQALVNLIKNGLEALDGNGRVVVSAAIASEMLEVAVSDTGPGLDAEQKAHLFEPGFTTKAHGSGLGLTIVERIVNDHHGTITVDGDPGPGTTFRIRIPVEPRT
ncbi:MAG TPA: ATP-binding protein [Candidatus Limnocylindria bacterium]|nr:ATP-binding protein [Candidatus Limnocylindria bacterium]